MSLPQLPPFFYQIFESLPRQGPGSSEATRKVWSLLPSVPRDAKILDVGCGSGTQTRDLAALTTGTITAVDIHQPFLDKVDAWVRKAGMAHRVKTICASMDALPFDKGSFDLIWSEGAIFIVGFEKGLNLWKPLLKKGGYMVVSDADWFEPNPPEELRKWWESEGYIPVPEEEMKERVKRTGLRLVATYRLPEAGWWDNYHVPMLALTAELRKIHGKDPGNAALLDAFEHEADMYRKYKRWYGYTFFVMQKV
ncbi:methyltransferase family protein [Methanoregula formicica SMSP]|uniref:Methyltransferase family protein n=1 Tax=Methanoregula formicica (strain DSM 22288 / NBRC 105244 / SMSP) TaxID=593750 RepID=L0HDQ5_METFS|nr:methyltransferase family protein [Methanoregula formicica SMSP]